MGHRFWLFYWHRPKPLPRAKARVVPPSLFGGGQGHQVPTSWGRQQESRQDQVWKGRRRDGVPPRIAATEIGGQGRDAQGPEPQQENRQRGGGERKKTSYIHMGRSQSFPLPTMLLAWLQPFPGGAQPARMVLENTFPETLYPDQRVGVVLAV